MRGWLLLSAACVAGDPEVAPEAVIDEAHALIDARYALFVDKEIDWDGAREEALLRLDQGDALEDALIDMLDVLEDGHTNLTTPTQISWATAFLEERRPTWDEDLVQRHVLEFDFRRQGSLFWSARPDWAYLRLQDFSGLSASSLVEALEDVEEEGSPGLVLDLRSNGGGRLGTAGVVLGHLIPERLDAWHLQVSTGPAHDDLSEPVARPVSPRSPGYDGPLAVLVDGRSYSAAHLVATVLTERPQTVLLGQETGGGAGSPTWHELANGWRLRFPTIRLTGPERRSMEQGLPVDVVVAPDPTQPEQDVMIEAARAALVALAAE